MKTLLLTTALSAVSLISVYGQEVARFGEFEIIPSSITSKGKSIPVGINYDDDTQTQTAMILDGNLNVVKRFNLKTASRLYSQYSEKATVKPSGAEIESYNQNDLWHNGEVVTATDMNSMIQSLSSIYGSDFYGFTDSKGRISCWSPQVSGFYYQNWFGTMYPDNYFVVVDGIVNEIHVSYKLSFTQADIDNAQWEYIEGDDAAQAYTHTAECFDFSDYDNNILCDNSITLSQTLFNDDDKWEYVIAQYGQVEKTVSDYWVCDSNENGIVLRRNATKSQPVTGYIIYNEDGNEIASIEAAEGFDDIYRISNNIYIECYSNGVRRIYKYDPATTSIQEVSQSESKTPIVKVNGRNITVEADGQNVDEAVLVDMGGRRVASSSRPGGKNVTIDAANMPGGVYNVAIKNGGKVTGAQKIVLK